MKMQEKEEVEAMKSYLLFLLFVHNGFKGVFKKLIMSATTLSLISRIKQISKFPKITPPAPGGVNFLVFF